MRHRILFILLFAAFVFCLLTPVSDPDFFWHLATGRWIWEHRELPSGDPFSYTTSLKAQEDFLRARIILTQYWLANIIQYGTYKLGGYSGIIALRLLVFSLTLFISFLHLRKKGLSVTASVVILLPLSYVLINFTGDRPNQMTFLFLALFLYLIESIRQVKEVRQVEAEEVKQVEKVRQVEDKKKLLNLNLNLNLNLSLNLNLFFLPIVMVIWANIHGGFILGAAISGIYMVSELLRVALGKIASRSAGNDGEEVRQVRQVEEVRQAEAKKKLLNLNLNLSRNLNLNLVITSALTILAGFLNPNGYNVLYSLVWETSAAYTTHVTETMTPFSFISLGTYRYVYMTALFLVPAGLSILVRLFLDNPPSSPLNLRGEQRGVALNLRGGVEGLRGEQRGVILADLLLLVFFGVLSFAGIRYIPLMALAMTPVIASLIPHIRLRLPAGIFMPGIAIVSAMIWAVFSYYPLTILKKPLLDEYYPEDAVRFIEREGLKGRLFNSYDWGGYLLWRFYPEKLVFADGRGLSQGAFLVYQTVMAGSKADMAGKPAYKAILDAYSVGNILISSIDVRGGIIPLISAIADDREWSLIYYSKNCLLFSRERLEPGYPKALAYAMALEKALQRISQTPDNPVPYLTVARANIGLRREGEALNFLEEALRRRGALRGGPVESALNLIRQGKDILRESHGLP